MLYTEEAVRAGLRVRDGRRVFYLPEGSRLTRRRATGSGRRA